MEGRDSNQHDRIKSHTLSSSFADDGLSKKSLPGSISVLKARNGGSRPENNLCKGINTTSRVRNKGLTSHMNTPYENTSLSWLCHQQCGARHAFGPPIMMVKRLLSGTPLFRRSPYGSSSRG